MYLSLAFQRRESYRDQAGRRKIFTEGRAGFEAGATLIIKKPMKVYTDKFRPHFPKIPEQLQSLAGARLTILVLPSDLSLKAEAEVVKIESSYYLNLRFP